MRLAYGVALMAADTSYAESTEATGVWTVRKLNGGLHTPTPFTTQQGLASPSIFGPRMMTRQVDRIS
jgi:hypothetical protein